MSDSILISKHNHLVTLTFNRPEKLNAFNKTMANRLAELCAQINKDQHIRVVLLQGAGEAFMSGTDLYELYRDLDSIPAEALSVIRQFNACILTLREMNKIVIAAVHGLVMGVGMSLMLAADLVIATENTKFSLGYSKIALSPVGATSYLLPRLVGTKKALELLLMTEIFDANTAQLYGLINWSFPQAVFAEQTQKIIDHIANGPMTAFDQTKQLLNSSWQNKLTTQLELEAEAVVKCVNTKDFKTAVRTNVNKRPPEFEGR